MDYNIILYIFISILPSLIWLSYYLTKDLHPEPKRMILSIFLWGAFMTIPVFFVQTGLAYLLAILSKTYLISPMVENLISWFVVIALSEEFFKYLIVRIKILDSPHLDEPLDLMLYMVVSALGFAAVENIFYLLGTMGQMSFNNALIVDLIRSLGAVFLHTLCSAVIGYALAVSICEKKLKKITLTAGILVAVALHGLFDFSIITLQGGIRFAIPLIIIITLAFLVFSGFGRLQKMKGICKI